MLMLRTTPPEVRLTGDTLRLGPVSVTFHRTLRIPDDGGAYPLPPSLGPFPVRRVDDYAHEVPAAWREHGGVFLPMFQREAMWLSFHGRPWRPNAIKVAVGKVNALSGETWSEDLVAGDPGTDGQDYMVVPDQPWLDGINAGAGYIKQFVAMPLGMGYTVEGQVTGREDHGGLQLCVFEPKPGRFPAAPPPPPRIAYDVAPYGPPMPMAMGALPAAQAAFAGQEMGLGAGGRMRQRIYPDPHGVETWDQGNRARVFVHLVNSQTWTAITGEPMPDSPVTARAYAEAGYPWFALYDERRGDIPPAEELAGAKSIKEVEAANGFETQQDDAPVDVPDHVVKKLAPAVAGPGAVHEAAW
jgi:hypothetical protein